MEENFTSPREASQGDKDYIITFDVRGKYIKTYASTLRLCNSSFFQNILGVKTEPQEDGSFFVDCYPDMFHWILGYIETGCTPTARFNPAYTRKICEKFGVPIKEKEKKKVPEPEPTPEHILKETVSREIVRFCDEHFSGNEDRRIILCLEFFDLPSGQKIPEIFVSDCPQEHEFERKKIITNTTITFRVPHRDLHEMKIICNSTNILNSFLDFTIPLQEKYKFTYRRDVKRTFGSVEIVLKFSPCNY